MKIKLNKIYAKLEAWRAERKITAQSQKDGYIINIMEELGELAAALRVYEKSSVTKQDAAKKQKAEHEIIDALCDIAIFTINAGADSNYKPQTLDTNERDEIVTQCVNYSLKNLLTDCGAFNIFNLVI